MNGIWYALILIGGLAAILLCLALVSSRLFFRALLRPVFELLYRKKIVGLENLPRENGCVVISNHVSWIDGFLILWMLPRNVRFVVDGSNFTNRFTRWSAAAFDTILMMPNPKSIGRALKQARQALIDGDVIGLFPEGTITRTGQLQSFKPGIKKILKGTDAVVVPMWLDGMWDSVFGFSGGKFFFKWPRRFRRTLTLYIGEPIAGTESLGLMRSRVQALGSRAGVAARREYPVLPSRVIRVWRRHGRRMQIADSTGVESGGRESLVKALVLRRVMRREILDDDEDYVGVLLPPSVGGVLVNVALSMDKRITANLNYTVSSDVINHCIKDVGIKHVLTSEKFLSKIDMEIDSNIVLLDSLKEKVSSIDKAIAFIQANLIPAAVLRWMLGLTSVQPDDLLTVIFTSGSTGMPKGVLLSHANISHNVDAIERTIHLDDDDTVLGVLPFFHSFGYSVTLWAAMVLGPKGVYHFNPLDARQVGKLAERFKATVLLGTPTFLRGYLRRIEPKQFENLDVVVVGAEKMPTDLFDAFESKFGIRPVEGYGTTELSPLVSVNIPPSRSSAKYQPDLIEGSVGRPLPGISAKIVSPDDQSVELADGDDGMLLIAGPNVMQGYANQAELTGKAIQDGWYSTGDIAHVDDQGFIHITGRLSRFSKIGGEMVPHIRIEEELAKVFQEGDDDDELRVCITAVPCTKKGERLIVLHRPSGVTPDHAREKLREAGLPNLFIPGSDSFFEVEEVPLLGTGKLDLKRAKELAAELAA